MTSSEIKALAYAAGAVAAGIAKADRVPPAEMSRYDRWIAAGEHGEMTYMEKYADVRSDPRLLLDGAQSVIATAFNYYTPSPRGRDGLIWARYSLGRDYHEELRERLDGVARAITDATGARCRVCVDTAPLRERYWAVTSGIGFTGRNGMLIIPGTGSWCLLGFIITTLPIPPDTPSADSCLGCGLCVDACPGHALDGNGNVDARRCRSYLTIEKRCDTLDTSLGTRIYGCDICQEVCPHNRRAPLSAIPAFIPRQSILDLGRDDILHMEQSRFSAIFTHSAIKRAKLAGLLRNARACDPDKENK